MEIFDTSELKDKAYHEIFMQKDGASEINHFMNTLNGEGLGNYFGAAAKNSIPVKSNSIKGSTSKKKSSVSPNHKANTRKRTVVGYTPHKKAKWQNL